MLKRAEYYTQVRQLAQLKGDATCLPLSNNDERIAVFPTIYYIIKLVSIASDKSNCVSNLSSYVYRDPIIVS